MSGAEPARRFRVFAEVVVEVSDEAAVRRAAVDAVHNTSFVESPGGPSVEQIVQEETDRVKDDLLQAVQWLVDPSDMATDVDHLEVLETTHHAVALTEHGAPLAAKPDFVSLFPVCACGREDCERCAGSQLTPRTAAVLWETGRILADQAFTDVLAHGDDPVSGSEDGDWAVFSQYPRITWRQGAVWRRQAARAFDDLVADIEAGDWLQPRCPGEEMALHLILRHGTDFVSDDLFAETLTTLPEHQNDLSWEQLYDLLFQDLDVLFLFDNSSDGVEDPDTAENQKMGIGDYRAPAWFETFDNMTPRDGRRPFRR